MPEALDVICRVCGESHYKTNTEDGFQELPDGSTIPNSQVRKFDPDKVATGNMFHLKEFYRKSMWSHFPYDSSATFGQLECCNCGAPLPNLSGKVKTRPQNGDTVPTPPKYDEDYEKFEADFSEQEEPQIVEAIEAPETFDTVIPLKSGEELKVKLSGSWSPEKKEPEPVVEPAKEAAHIGEPIIPYSDTPPDPVDKTPMTRLQAFLEARPGDVWEGDACGCTKTRADFDLELSTCSECCAVRDSTAKRKTSTK